MQRTALEDDRQHGEMQVTQLTASLPCEDAIWEEEAAATVEPLDDGSPGWQLDCNLVRDLELHPPS